MRVPGARWVAFSLLAFTLVVAVLSVQGLVDSWHVENENEWTFRGFGLTVSLAFALAGGLIALKRPDNAVGWLFCAAGSLFALNTAAEVFAVLPLIQGTTSDSRYFVAWLASWMWVPGLGLIASAILLFPTGRIPSPRWAWPARSMAVAWIIAGFSFAFAPGPLNNIPLANRYALPSGPVTDALVGFGGLCVMAALLTSAVAVVQRYRASEGLQRQQMKLFALAAAGQPMSIGLVLVAELLAPGLLDAFATLQGLMTVLIPVAMAVAILRYRLYDIDVIINRTLVYGALTAILLFAYLGLVVTLQGLLDPLTTDSDLAVAASTLAVAALFRPLRGRVQGFIDRRFYRRRYDATQTLREFSARLRDQIDLDSLTSEVLAVVGTTIQPAHASLWLRTPTQAAP